MKTVYKGIVFAFTAAIILSLCLAPAVFATEELTAATPSDAEVKLLTATSSDAEEVKLLTATSSNAVADTVSTGEELMEWLSGHKDVGGDVKLAADISLGDFYYARNMRAAPVTIDTGEFTIAINGYVYLQATSPLTIRGVGGEQGLLRTSGAGSMLHLNGIDLEAETGYAVFQEEGTGFILDTLENTSVSGDVHYAKQPFAWEWEPAPALAVVERGKTLEEEMLPAALSVAVNRQGQIIYPYEEVPVIWDLSGHEEDQKLRRRFTVPGEFEGMASQTPPDCTVVYDDFPLTFLDVNAVKMKGTYGASYRLRGTFSKPEDRLPITVAQEYSFDGKNWMLYEEKTITTFSSDFYITLFVGAEDSERFPEFFIRLSWNDEGTVHYSNVLSFEMDSLEAKEEPGGNRGGGTDIVDPPKQPEPDSEPETTPPPVTSEPETTPPPVTSKPETTPPPVTSEPETVPPETMEPETTPPETSRSENSGGSHGDGERPSHGNMQKPDLPGGSSDHEDAPPISVPKSAAAPGPVSEPVLANETVVSSRAPSATVSEPPESTEQISAVPPPSGEDAEVLAEPEVEPAIPGPDVLPVAAGLAAVAVSIGGAAFYLHPQVWKRLLGKLRNHIRR